MSRTARTVGVLATVAAAFLTTAGACQRPDPCRFLGPPTAADVAVANAGREVEVEVDSNGRIVTDGAIECVVSGGRWVASQE